MTKQESQRGSMTLETAIVLPIFFFLLLFIYSLFGIFSAHNQITHALVQSAKSLSLDPYIYDETELLGESTFKFWGSLGDIALNIFRADNDEYYMSTTDWYNQGDGAEAVVRKRFVGYLSGGDENAAQEKLEGLRVIDGLNGIDFTVSVADDMLTIKIDYTLKFLFDFWEFGEMPVSQSIQVKLWK